MTLPITPTDFSGVLVIAAPSATAALNAAGLIVKDQVSSLHYLSLGSTSNGGSLAQNAPIEVIPAFPYNNKALVNAPKKTGATWTAGQKLYISTGGIWQTMATGGTVDAIALADAASTESVGTVLPCVPA